MIIGISPYVQSLNFTLVGGRCWDTWYGDRKACRYSSVDKDRALSHAQAYRIDDTSEPIKDYAPREICRTCGEWTLYHFRCFVPYLAFADTLYTCCGSFERFFDFGHCLISRHANKEVTTFNWTSLITRYCTVGTFFCLKVCVSISTSALRT